MKATYRIAMAVAQDAGNRSMKEHHRSKWNEEDYNVACAAVRWFWPKQDDEPRTCDIETRTDSE